MEAVSRPERRPAEDPADASLVRRMRAGDRTAVDDLYERYRRPAFALARRILADDVLAEDVLQDVFLSVWRDPGAFDRSRGSFPSWLLAMVHHKAVDAVRREATRRRHHPTTGEPDEGVPASGPSAARGAAFAHHCEQVRAALHLEAAAA